MFWTENLLLTSYSWQSPWVYYTIYAFLSSYLIYLAFSCSCLALNNRLPLHSKAAGEGIQKPAFSHLGLQSLLLATYLQKQNLQETDS
ncbi:hypothetical protein ACB092_09G167800 [Castanea dentata]